MKKLTVTTIDETLLTKLQANAPDHQPKMWGYTSGRPASFKKLVTTHLLTDQSRRCAYCGCRLMGMRPHRDHIAPKESHPEFTFTPANLVLACNFCNEECKGTSDTISLKNLVYDACTFSIIHPYFDEPADHIQFVGGVDQILIQIVAGSPKGQSTVNMFKLDSPELSKQRAKEALLESDLEYMPGPWREGLECLVFGKLKVKYQS